MTNYVHVISEPATTICGLNTTLFATGTTILGLALSTWAILVSLSVRKASEIARADSAKADLEKARLNRISTRTNLHTMLTRKKLMEHQIAHDKLSVRPSVMNITNHVKGPRGHGFHLLNVGPGIARVLPPLLLIDEKPLALFSEENKKTIKERLKKELGMPAGMTLAQWTGPYMSIGAGTQQPLIYPGDKIDDIQMKEWMNAYANRIRFLAPYSSIYEEEVLYNYVGSIINEYPEEVLQDIWPKAKYNRN